MWVGQVNLHRLTSACARRAASATRASRPSTVVVMTADTPPSCIMAPTRSAGYTGSRGRYAARVICTASSAACVQGLALGWFHLSVCRLWPYTWVV